MTRKMPLVIGEDDNFTRLVQIVMDPSPHIAAPSRLDLPGDIEDIIKGVAREIGSDPAGLTPVRPSIASLLSLGRCVSIRRQRDAKHSIGE